MCAVTRARAGPASPRLWPQHGRSPPPARCPRPRAHRPFLCRAAPAGCQVGGTLNQGCIAAQAAGWGGSATRWVVKPSSAPSRGFWGASGLSLRSLAVPRGLRALSVVLNPLSRVFKPLQAGSRWGRRTCRRREADREFPEPPLGVGHSVLVTRAPRASAVHWTVAEHLPSA